MVFPSARQLKETMWRRHRNPWSGWTRVPLGFLLGIALWYHSWIAIAVCALAAVTNPFWFPPPKSGDSWMTRAVDGEKIWLARAGRLERFLLLALPGVQGIPLIWALWMNQPVWTAYFAAWALAQKTAFVIWTADIARHTDYNRALGPPAEAAR
jgi:hypothetical protein